MNGYETFCALGESAGEEGTQIQLIYVHSPKLHLPMQHEPSCAQFLCWLDFTQDCLPTPTPVDVLPTQFAHVFKLHVNVAAPSHLAAASCDGMYRHSARVHETKDADDGYCNRAR